MILPRITWKTGIIANGSNSLLRGITMRVGASAAVLAQEVAEWNYRFARVAPVCALVAALAGFGAWQAIPPLYAILTALGAAAVAFGMTDKIVTDARAFEYWGKAVEWRAAVRMGADSESYLRNEALSLAIYSAHMGDPIEKTIAGIRANEAEADAWLNEHWAKVLGAHNRG
jgi:hypothetical protein